MTSIFRDGRGFVPTTIFTPQFVDYHSDYQQIPYDTEIKNNKKKSNLNITDSNTISSTQINDDISFKEDTNINNIRFSARLAYERLYKKKDENIIPDNQLSDTTNNDIEKNFYYLAEKRLYRQAETDYDNFITKREIKIRAEYKRLQEQDEYNQELVTRAIEAKQRTAEKKRRRREYLKFFIGLLLGDADDPSIPKLILGILTAYHPGFLRLWKLTAQRVNPVSPISPVTFGFGGGYYTMHPDVSVKVAVKPNKHLVFASIYRTWCNQFVRKIIEKRQRGPPLNWHYS